MGSRALSRHRTALLGDPHGLACGRPDEAVPEVCRPRPSIAPGGQRPGHGTRYAHAVTSQIAAAAPPDPALATVIISPLASRIRDGRTRAKIAWRTAEALGARGHREVVVVEASSPAAVRDAAA